MIPTFIDIGGPWKVLPPGEHDACLYEVKKCFAINDCRIKLYAGIKRGCEVLKFAGCSIVFLDGSYITNKSTPGDFDLCWDPKGVNPVKLDPVLLDFSDNRKKRSEEHTSELQSHSFISYAVFCLKKKT